MNNLKDFGMFTLKTAGANMVINAIVGLVPPLGNFYRNPIGTVMGLFKKTS